MERLGDPRRVAVELHAGKDYCEPAGEHLRAAGFTVERPLMGLSISEQLGSYKRRRELMDTVNGNVDRPKRI